jgi:ketosteroid isomerase-like protein
VAERSVDVENVVRAWLRSKQSAEAEGIRRSLSTYDGALAVGTEDQEWWAGPNFTEAHVAGRPFELTLEHVEAHREGSVGWAAARARVGSGGDGETAVRLTLVLMQEAGRWQIVQTHVSVPEPPSPT